MTGSITNVSLPLTHLKVDPLLLVNSSIAITDLHRFGQVYLLLGLGSSVVLAEIITFIIVSWAAWVLRFDELGDHYWLYIKWAKILITHRGFHLIFYLLAGEGSIHRACHISLFWLHIIHINNLHNLPIEMVIFKRAIFKARVYYSSGCDTVIAFIFNFLNV